MSTIWQICQIVPILNEHIDVIVVFKCPKVQPTATSTSYVIAMHVPEGNMPTTVHIIYGHVFWGHSWRIYVHICDTYEVIGTN